MPLPKDLKNLQKSVVIFSADMDKCNINTLKLWRHLSDAEKEKASSYYTKTLTDRYIISHGLLRVILSYYMNQPPHSLEFTINSYGKPFLKNGGIQFNISHSYNIVCYIVAFDNKVGIDIEYQDKSLNIIDLASLVLSFKEMKLLNSVIDENKYILFYDIWTAKESLVKALGEGLYFPINAIETFQKSTGDKFALINNQYKTTQELYYYKLDLIPGYSGAISTGKEINEIRYIEMFNSSHALRVITNLAKASNRINSSSFCKSLKCIL